jgi:hypothetical protein
MGSAVGTATFYGLDDRGFGVYSWWMQELSLLRVVQIGSGPTQPSTQLVLGDPSPGSKAAGA